MALPYPPTRSISLPNSNPRGTLGWGVAVFYIALAVGYIFCVGLAQMLRGRLTDDALLIAYGLGAWLFPLAVGTIYAVKRKTRTAWGVLLGFGILLGVAVFLLAAALGYSALTTMGAMH